ncbi:MAG: hypothetical protein KatS3mg002_0131 [Candidatus Woesearchaeota archaeon]|nr:MAG: hypothetical protein KatS3mg002_0131 [Candidatus Woesearchaeota archaeon]
MTIDAIVENSAAKKILIVDDALSNEDFKASIDVTIGKYCTQHGYQLDIVTSERDALSKIAQSTYDIVFTDGSLFSNHGNPDYSSGVHVAKAAKESKAYVVGISSQPKVFGELAKDYLDINYKKPFSIMTLIKIIEEKPSKEEFEKYDSR